MADAEESSQRTHRKRQAGPKADKKKKRNHGKDSNAPKNPKAFALQSTRKAARSFHRKLDLETKKRHVPLVDRTPLEPPPIIVAIVGPPKVGKTSLIRCLIKNFSRQKVSDIKGPVTVVSGKKRRITFVECNNDINCMIDIAKIADLVLLLIDASFGFEMEIFEFLNIAQVHGFPKIMGVLTHLDLLKNNKSLRKAKKKMKQRFWTEVYQGAKLFYLSGLTHGSYPKTEIHNLGRFISVMKFRPLTWRTTHPYLLVDRLEDLTDQDKIREKPKDDRTICMYGFVRGTSIKLNSKLHVLGCGDYHIQEISSLPDPCPLPHKERKRSLNEKERLIYAPMSGVGGIVYDKDAVYIDFGGSQAGRRRDAAEITDEMQENNEIVTSLLGVQETIDNKMSLSQLSIFKNSAPVAADEVQSDKKWTLFKEEEVQDKDGRTRRKVIFDDDNDGSENEPDSDDNSDSDDGDHDGDNEDSDNEDSDEVHIPNGINHEKSPKAKRRCLDKDKSIEFDDSGDSESEDEHKTEIQKWKEEFESQIYSALPKRSSTKVSDLKKMIYGKELNIESDEHSEDDDKDEAVTLGGLFTVKNTSKKKRSFSVFHANDCSRESFGGSTISKYDELLESIRDCFVIGKWNRTEDEADAFGSDNEDVYGDFEDLETGDVFKGENEEKGDQSDNGSKDEEMKESSNDEDEHEERIEKKKKLKETFNAEYDDDKGDTSYYDDLKEAMSEQAKLNQAEFEGMDDDVRVQYEGYRPGMYVRIEIGNMPSEFINNFDPSYPVILGGLLAGEDNIGYIQARFKKHRWHDKILKNRDPIVVSLGWRRFQTIPLYSVQDHNGRHRSIKYTPEHLHCIATMYGPITPPNTGLLAVHSISGVTAKFRIAATGVIIDVDKSTQVVKKLKLIGTPMKIFKNTAFVKGMFNSSLEVAKFEGAKIRTVSGLRGQIKKGLKNPEGAFRATFEDKILMSDILFCRTWYPVECPKYFNPVTSMLLNKENKNTWQGMRTVGQIRKDEGLKPPVNQDSFYKTIERQTRKFNPLHIPKKLQKELPFKSKPKEMKKQKKLTLDQRRAVLMEPHEKKVYTLMKELFTAHNEKVRKRKETKGQKRKEFKRKQEKIDENRQAKFKEQRQKVYRMIGKAEKRKQRATKNKHEK